MRLIDADALCQALGLTGLCDDCKHSRGLWCVDAVWKEVCRAIINAPTVDPATARRGRWIISPKTQEGYCSKCKFDMPVMMDDWKYKSVATNYCPNCGAKMEADDE